MRNHINFMTATPDSLSSTSYLVDACGQDETLADSQPTHCTIQRNRFNEQKFEILKNTIECNSQGKTFVSQAVFNLQVFSKVERT